MMTHIIIQGPNILRPETVYLLFFEKLGMYNFSSETYSFPSGPYIFGQKPAQIIVNNRFMQQPGRVIAKSRPLALSPLLRL